MANPNKGSRVNRGAGALGAATLCFVCLLVSACGGGGGGGGGTATVDLSVSSESVAPGATITLTWSSSNATSCAASGAWSGVKATSGSETVQVSTGSASFALVCTGERGSATTSRTVATSLPLPPAIDLLAEPASVAQNESSELTWSVTNATGCSASGGWTGERNPSGSESVGPLVGPTQFSLQCSGLGGTTTASVTIEVPTPRTLNLKLDKTVAAHGSMAVIYWNASSVSPTSCDARGAWDGSVPEFGAEPVGPLLGEATFVLVCQTASGEIEEQVAIDVLPADTPLVSAPAFARVEFVEYRGRDADHSVPVLMTNEPLSSSTPAELSMELLGDPISVAFSLTADDGTTIGAVDAQPVVETEFVLHDYRAQVALPPQPFRVRATGTDASGQSFTIDSRVFSPQQIAVRFPTPVGIAPAGFVVTDLVLEVLNTAAARDLIVTVTAEPDVGVIPTRTVINVDGRAEIMLSFAMPTASSNLLGVDITATVETAPGGSPAERNQSTMTFFQE